MATPLERSMEHYFGGENIPTPENMVGVHPLAFRDPNINGKTVTKW
jgi:hypothetical protein